MQNTPIVLIILIILAMSGVLLVQLFIGLREMLHGWSSHEWPMTEGVVMESVGMGRTRMGPGWTNQPSQVRVTYTYTVEGRTYQSRRRRFGGDGMSVVEHAPMITARYPVGAHVTVFHHPRRPELAVLEPGVVVPASLKRLFVFVLVLAAMSPFLQVIWSGFRFYLTHRLP